MTPPRSLTAAARRGAVLLLLAIGAAVWSASPAAAHSLVERSDPPANRLLLRAPSEIALTFSEPVDPLRTEIRVLDQDGRRFDRQRFQFSPGRRQARLPVRLPGPGIYTVTWRTLSTVDLHTYEGFFTFTVGPLRPGSFALQAGAPQRPAPWDVAARWLIFLGAAALGGGLLIHRILLPAALGSMQVRPAEDWMLTLHRRWRVSTWLAGAALLVGVLGELISQAAQAAHAAGDDLRSALVQVAAGEPTRTALLLKLAAPVVLLVLLRRRTPWAPVQPEINPAASAPLAHVLTSAEVVLASLVLLGISLTSHAAATQAAFPLVADWLHLLSAASWVGGLIYLGTILVPALGRMDPQHRPQLLGPLVQRFSNLALTSVSILIVTGIYAAWVNIPTLGAVTATAYGRTLAIKIALLLPLLGTAAVNLLAMRPRLVAAARTALAWAQSVVVQGRFFRLVRSEAVLASLVLLAAAALVLLPTARQVWALGPAQEIALVRRTDQLEGMLRIIPYQVGGNTFELRLRTLQPELPIPDARVRFTFLPLAASMGTAVADAAPQNDGRYVLEGAYMASRGPWLITVTVHWGAQQEERLLYPVEPDWARGRAIAPPADPQALAMLQEADAAMNRLRSLRQRQEIADGHGNDVVTFFELAVPNKLRYRVIGGLEAIYLDRLQFVKQEGQSWRREEAPWAFQFPNFRLAGDASNVVLGPRERVDGTSAQVVTFILNLAGSRARYAVWIDEKTHRILREFMVAQSHSMIVRNYDFDAPVKISAPTRE